VIDLPAKVKGGRFGTSGTKTHRLEPGSRLRIPGRGLSRAYSEGPRRLGSSFDFSQSLCSELILLCPELGILTKIIRANACLISRIIGEL
jgi:hypothetical protein